MQFEVLLEQWANSQPFYRILQDGILSEAGSQSVDFSTEVDEVEYGCILKIQKRPAGRNSNRSDFEHLGLLGLSIRR